MAKKTVSKVENDNLEATKTIARQAWQVAAEAHANMEEMRVMFHAIREQSGGHGPVASLASLGRTGAQEYRDRFDCTMSELRDALRDAHVGCAP